MKKKIFIPLLAIPVLAIASISIAVGKKGATVKDETAIGDKVDENTKQITCSFPVKNEKVDILRPAMTQYIAAMKEQAKNIETDDYKLHDFYVYGTTEQPENETDKVRVSNFYSQSTNLGRAKQVTLVFDSVNFDEETEYEVTYGFEDDLSDGIVIKTINKFVTITNLLARSKYYWKVTAGDVSSAIESFVTDEGFRYVTANGIANVRDMGGRPVAGGKHIKQGLIFRGGEVVYETAGQHTANITEENAEIFTNEMKIGYEIDFRGDEESGYITEAPLKTYYREEKGQDINMDYMRINNMGAYDYFFKMSKTDTRWEGVKNMFLAFKNANEKHIYFHCWGGADRTGTAGFLLGGLLGMSYTDLVIDFELTSFANNYRPHNVNDPKGVYRFPAFINALRTEKDSLGNTYWTAEKTISQIVEDILIDKAGLTEQDILDIKANLLEE